MWCAAQEEQIREQQAIEKQLQQQQQQGQPGQPSHQQPDEQDQRGQPPHPQLDQQAAVDCAAVSDNKDASTADMHRAKTEQPESGESPVANSELTQAQDGAIGDSGVTSEETDTAEQSNLVKQNDESTTS